MRDKTLSSAFIFVALIVIGFARPSTAEIVSSVSKTSALELSLPLCVKLESDIVEIQRVQKANSKMASKYDGYRNILHASTALELATRLAYAETLAANCPSQEDQILDWVTSVIGNRIRIREGNVNSVVFQRDQFSSSLNMYAESRYRDFLCPTDRGLWQRALTKMRVNLEQSKPSSSIPQDTVNYYFYRHSNRFKAPDWKLEQVSIGEEKIRECIRVFRDPAWK